MHEGIHTNFKEKIKNIIFINGTRECRDDALEYFEVAAPNKMEALQFGFFLKTYAAIITNTTEDFISENKNNEITFSSENILKKIYGCVCDTVGRLEQKEIAYNKMALLHILNLFTNYTYRLEHEIPETITVNTNYLLRQIGEVWKQVFTPTIWSDLVITAIKRSDKKYIVLTDFRFPEEYFGISELSVHNCFTIKIISDIEKLYINKENDYHISEYALEKFQFDYIVNCTIPYKANKLTNPVLPQIQSIYEHINLNYPLIEE